MLQLVPTNWYALPHTYFVQIVLSDNEWDQVRDTNDHRLCIGVLPFHKQGTQTFTAANNCRDVLSALQLMLHLQLEPYNIDADNSKLTDSLMLLLKETSRPLPGRQSINVNSFGKVNKSFCRFVIDFLSVQLVFDNWFPFRSQAAPAPFTRDINNTSAMTAVAHNQRILIELVQQMEPFRAHNVLLNRGESGWPVPNLKQLYSQVNTYVVRFRKGIISSWIGYNEEKLSECLWIHHWVILQFLHPTFHVRLSYDLQDDPNIVFKHPNWEQFVKPFDENAVQHYLGQHGEVPSFGLLWLGKKMA